MQKRWRQLAIKYHPDKASGNKERFKILKSKYEQLKSSCSVKG
ncbi:MAG: DnaJ domain-containing protein [Pseudoalteromonas sp.]